MYIYSLTPATCFNKVGQGKHAQKTPVMNIPQVNRVIGKR